MKMAKPDMHTLAHHLKQERLYVASEKQLIQRLNADVLKTAERLHRCAWIAKQQRINLDRLVLASAETSPAECCQQARALEDAHFLEAYKALGFQESTYGYFLNQLRQRPRLLASCLVIGQRLGPEASAQAVLRCVFASLYANCIMPEDEAYLLQVLRYLMEFELKTSDDPRRLLSQPTCAFTVLFRLFSEGLAAAKLFLTASLHQPIMHLLESDEDPLETDPARLPERHAPAERARLFGEAGSEGHARKVREVAEANGAKLAGLAERFAASLRQNVYCFPPGLRWALAGLHGTLAQARGVGPAEARAACAHLLLACFVCPAAVNPERYGIVSDAPVNEAARFNLSQVAQLLQQIAVGDPDEAQSLQMSSLAKFDKSCVAAFLDAVIGGKVSESPPVSSNNLLEGLSRTAVCVTQSELFTLVKFVRSVMDELTEEDQQALETLLAGVPHSHPGKSNSLERTSASAPELSPSTPPVNKKNRQPAASRGRSRSSLAQDGEASSQESLLEVMPEEVLVISLGFAPQSLPGMMSESELLSLQGGQGEGSTDDSKLQEKADKTLHFSLCSDNLEATSEGPSNRSNSVSSLDVEGESASEPGAGNGEDALQLLELEQATTQDNLDDKLRKFEIRDILGLTDERDFSETMSETWSTDVLGSDFDPNTEEDRLQEIAEAGDLKQEDRLQELESCSAVGSTSDDTEVREVSSRPSTPGLSTVSGVSVTSEEIPNKTEDLRSECSSDFGGKDSTTSAERGERTPGFSTGAVVRPKVQHTRPPHPPPDPPILEAYALGEEPRLSLFVPGPLGQVEAEPGKQRHSCPDRLVLSRSLDLSCPARRPTSDPGVLRRGVADNRDPTSGFGPGPTSPSRNALTGEVEERKDSDEEKPDRIRPWWKKRFVSAIPRAPMAAFRRKDRPEREEVGLERAQQEGDMPLLSTQAQAAEDILDKYRNIKRSDNGGEADSSVQESLRDDALQNFPSEDLPASAPLLHHRYTFSDAKKKLRQALCSADSVVLPLFPDASIQNGQPDHSNPEGNEIMCFLKVQLAEAINLQDKSSMAQIQETTRCIAHLDPPTCRKLLTAIADDYRQRAPYVAYLTRCRQGLQATLAHLDRMLQRVLRDKDVANRHFTTVCVRLFLEGMEAKMQDFIKAFQGCTAADDKTASVEDFLRYLYGAMAHDDTWQYASEEQLQDAQAAIERSVMNRIFKLAFYPNLDGDVLRDQLLQEHMQRLSKVVTANHKALQIPEVYLKEAPWPSAQAEIRAASAYKTPRDKLQCILRMCSSIMNLLSLANERSVPGADDFVPVLVFVLIKANPPCLLSTVQYINHFYASRLGGEECYWWMQFTAAVEFIKTIDDRK